MTEFVPLDLVTARQFVATHHRHNEPPIGHRFSIGLMEDGALIGVVMVGRPVARNLDQRLTVELTRVTTTGTRNSCSRLYSRACRAAAMMGYRMAVTYTLPSESGASLRAAGFVCDGENDSPVDGWSTRSPFRLRLFDAPLRPQGPKTRWHRSLTHEASR